MPGCRPENEQAFTYFHDAFGTAKKAGKAIEYILQEVF